jgi:lysine-specific demethylase 8
MAFCGSPKQALSVASDASCLQEITTNNCIRVPVDGDDGNDFLNDVHALHCCRHKCGVVYCSLECQQDDWEWGGHQELCTGTIPDPVENTSSQPHSDTVIDNQDEQNDGSSTIDSFDATKSQMDPLLKFKIHAMETNEIFLLVATWLVRILKNNLPYNDDDNLNTHPYTDFQMNAWWDVKTNEDATLKMTQKDEESQNDDEKQNQGESLGTILKQLCLESHSYLSEALKSRLSLTRSSRWLSTIGMARLIGSLEQNCLGIRRKHALQLDIMQNKELRHEFNAELIQCLEGAGVIGNDDDDSSCGCGDEEIIDINTSDTNTKHIDENLVHDTVVTRADAVDKAIVVDADENSNQGTESVYSPDDIAGVFANLTRDLTDNCMYDEWDQVITPLDGVSHYSISTKMNHSCEPNVILVYKTRGWGRDHPLVAYVVALKDIVPGEELTISYITSEDSYEERQAALANYGFVCKCSKCEREKGDTVKGDKALASGIECVDKNDLFGKEDEEDEDDVFGDDDDLFGEDEDDDGNADDEDLFGDDEDDDGHGDDDVADANEGDEQLSGEERLSNVAERLDTILNKSTHIAIPLTCLAPVSNYVVRQVSSLLQDIQIEEGLGDDKQTIENLLEQNMTAVRDRDFASCRIVGSDLELFLYHQLASNGSWATLMHRACYWCASITASIGYAHEGSFLVSMKYLDKAIILGQDRSIIKSYFEYVEMYASQMAAGPCPIAVECKVSDYQCPKLRDLVTTKALSQKIDFPINEISSNNDSNATNVLAACNESESLVIRGLASQWLAVKTWRNMDAMAREFGHRLVPTEVGSMSNEMKEAVVPFRRFVAKYLSPSAEKDCWSLDDATADTNHHIAYLAQHPLLNQIPALCNDIDMSPCGVKPTNVNIWMGTGGTRTPLHFDTYDNLLVQLVGAKYVRLYKKESGPKLYVSKDKSYGGQGNMSELDCEREDFAKHPSAKDCSYTEVVLFPGDCLFIPSREWHYVRSLSTSVSINYWF